MANKPNDLEFHFIKAVVQDKPKAMQLLKKYPQLKNARYMCDETPLHYLAVEGYEEEVRYLVQLGFDVDAKNCFGETALWDVASMGCDKMVEMLLSLGANPNLMSSETRDSILISAIESQNIRTVELLLQNKVDPNAIPDPSHNAMLAAVESGNEKMLDLLIVYGGDPNIASDYYGNVLSYAVEEGNFSMVEILLSHGADPNATPDPYKNAMFAAFESENEKVLDLLVAYGGDLNIASDPDGNLLSYAVAGGNLNMVEYLLSHKADPHYITQNGCTIHDALERAPDKRAILDVFKKQGIRIQ